MTVAATDTVPTTTTTTSPHQVTTWLSGPRTDIFGQYSLASVKPSASGVQQSTSIVDEEVTFQPVAASSNSAVAANSAVPITATGYAAFDVCSLSCRCKKR